MKRSIRPSVVRHPISVPVTVPCRCYRSQPTHGKDGGHYTPIPNSQNYKGNNKFKLASPSHTKFMELWRQVKEARPGAKTRFLPGTLSPTSLKESDLVDLSNRVYHMDMSDYGISASRSAIYYTYNTVTKTGTPFPPGTRGFFYWKKFAKSHRMSGELRFRIASDASEESFTLGRDLIGPDEFLWRIPAVTILSLFPPLLEQLKADGYLSERHIQPFRKELARFVWGDLPKMGDPVLSVGSIKGMYTDPFLFNFATMRPAQAWFIHGPQERLYRILLRVLLHQDVPNALFPTGGTAVFELIRRNKMLPEGLIRNRWLLRCLKVLEPIQFPSWFQVEAFCLKHGIARDQISELVLTEGELVSARGRPVHFDHFVKQNPFSHKRRKPYRST
ncbi:hypothetical protein FKP32DRAFT_1589807 [Trametes sanguinea]|nr:hypothetical protein FKP32DRAFT_1589807 [Trametes sanguinea]